MSKPHIPSFAPLPAPRHQAPLLLPPILEQRQITQTTDPLNREAWKNQWRLSYGLIFDEQNRAGWQWQFFQPDGTLKSEGTRIGYTEEALLREFHAWVWHYTVIFDQRSASQVRENAALVRRVELLEQQLRELRELIGLPTIPSKTSAPY